MQKFITKKSIKILLINYISLFYSVKLFNCSLFQHNFSFSDSARILSFFCGSSRSVIKYFTYSSLRFSPQISYFRFQVTLFQIGDFGTLVFLFNVFFIWLRLHVIYSWYLVMVMQYGMVIFFFCFLVNMVIVFRHVGVILIFEDWVLGLHSV